MSTIVATVATDGSYRVDVAVAHHRLRLIIDTGFFDPKDRVGLALDPMIYDALLRSSQLGAEKIRSAQDASGNSYYVRTGLVEAQLLDSSSKAAVGPKIRIRALRGVSGVDSRVGVAFFHRLAGCRLIWELDQRAWCIEYP